MLKAFPLARTQNYTLGLHGKGNVQGGAACKLGEKTAGKEVFRHFHVISFMLLHLFIKLSLRSKLHQIILLKY